MGISTLQAKILFYSTTLGVSFDQTLTLGRQNLYTSKNDIRRYVTKFMNDDLVAGDELDDNEYSEPLFKNLRASLIDSMDNSTYQGATVIHDLNKPIGSDMKDKYSAIIDGGLLEHVFNIPVAIKNCMQMLRVGGHFISFTTANNFCGHGFYQFSPELFFRIFSSINGFDMTLMAIHAGVGTKASTDVYLVKDPDDVKARVEFLSNKELTLVVIAQKIKDTDIFSEFPQQSDYARIWSAKDIESKTFSKEKISTLRAFYKKKIPLSIRNVIYRIYYYRIRYRKTNYWGFARVHKAFVDKLDF
ncbi:uncharacterized protein METZ01_LOCUS246665 [marine metagenome]|uniref:Methyltransferase type 11 domain-containing protein n=1 Tax=marine metagenome TaxID=408172 RepID=A0A382I523_9ZZZZ